jgi:FkbM family methyltransferase
MLSRVRSQLRYARHLARSSPEAAAHASRLYWRIVEWRVRSLLPNGTTVPFDRFNCRLWIPPEWRGMSKMAFILRDAYEPELPHLTRWIDHTSVTVDIGAHYGAWTVAMASVAARCHAIEPSPHALEVLNRNIDLNHLSNVEVHACALGGRPGHLELRDHADPSRASFTLATEDNKVGHHVEVRRLDDLITEPVDFIKIDIEGYEFPALMGAKRILTEDRPVVLLEVQEAAAERGGIDPYGAWTLLHDLDYRFEQLLPSGSWEPLLTPSQIRTPNVVAFPRRRDR